MTLFMAQTKRLETNTAHLQSTTPSKTYHSTHHSTLSSNDVLADIDQPLPPASSSSSSHHPNTSTTPSTVAPFIPFVDTSTARHLRQVQNGRGVMTSRAESFYSAAVVLTIGGIFVAITMTASLALFVFWRKTNTVFVLQKCEQRDYADEDDDDEDSPAELNGGGHDPNESRLLTESDSDGASRIVAVKKKRTKKSSQSKRSRKRWLPVSSCDTDDTNWHRQSEMTSSTRMSTYEVADYDDDDVAVTTRLSSVSNDAVDIGSGVVEMMADEVECELVMGKSETPIAETRFTHI